MILGWLTHDKDATRNNLRIPHEPIEIGRLLGWTEVDGGASDQLTFVAAACKGSLDDLSKTAR
jgi:hypothetical protein